MADTSAILAAIITDEPRHEECRAVLSDATAAFVTPHVTAEVYYLLTAAQHNAAARDFLTDIAAGFYEVINPGPEDYGLARELIQQYDGRLHRRRPKSGLLDLADAMNVIAARRAETNLIATLDQDYRSIKPLGGAPYFALVPDDLPGAAGP